MIKLIADWPYFHSFYFFMTTGIALVVAFLGAYVLEEEGNALN